MINGWSSAAAEIPEGWGAMMQPETIQNPRRPARVPGQDNFAERLCGYIESKASGRIRDLRVVCTEGQVILTGRSRTYHAKQLAQEAALDLIAGRPTLANQIEVG